MKTYRAVRGSTLSHKDAKVVGRRLEALGSPTPEEIVDDARAESSPLHRFFEWDVSKAHEIYLLERARYLVRAVTVHVTGESFVRAFHSVVVQAEGDNKPLRAYVSTERVALDKGMREQVVKRALEEAEAWQRRYANLESSFREVFQAIARTRRKLSHKKAKSA